MVKWQQRLLNVSATGSFENVREEVVIIFYILLGVIVILVTLSFWWRWASRRRQLPCPTWLAWFLDTPLLETITDTQATLDRIGLREGDSALDVGCGPGRLTIPAADRVGPTGIIVALDIQPEMLTRLQRQITQDGITNIIVQLGDISSDDSLPPNNFDCAWLVTVLGEIPDRLAALQNLYRVLKPGGTLSITEILGDPHYQTRRTVLRLGQEAGFEPTQHWKTLLTFTQNFTRR
jgi:SAM-dependent methyltransferase